MGSDIDALLQEAVSSGRFLGVSLVVVDKNGKTIYSGAHGRRSFNSEEPMKLSTPAWLASMSKLMTSVAALHAVQEGLVGLDDDLGDVLPELRQQEVLTAYNQEKKRPTFEPLKEKITLRRLLSHASGFAYPFFSPALNQWANDNDQSTYRFVGDFKSDWDRPPVFQPGMGWCYGQGIDWAGKVVEKVSGRSLQEYLHENVWAPLGMANTTFHPERKNDYALLDLGKRESGPGSKMVPAGGQFYPIPAINEAGGIGLYSSAEDYAKLLAALLRGDNRVLKKKMIDELVKPQLNDIGTQQINAAHQIWVVPEIPKEITVDYALGGLVTTSALPGGRSVGAMAWDGMSSPHWLLDRVTGIAMVFITQILAPDPDSKELWAKLEQQVYSSFARL